MWDVSLNQTIERPPCSIAKGDQVPDMVSVGWTNESHSMYISSMEASFMQQLHGHEHHAPVRNRSHVGANGIKVIQEGAMDGLISQKNDSRSRDIGIRCLLENPWMRRFKPRSSGTNRRGDGVGASVDDGESGTDTVQERIPTHVRDLKSCVGENLVDKSSETKKHHGVLWLEDMNSSTRICTSGARFASVYSAYGECRRGKHLVSRAPHHVGMSRC